MINDLTPCEAALEYARLGLHVFPIKLRDKIPLIPTSRGGHGHRNATTDESKIMSWWSRSSSANIGIATGKSSGIFVSDIDPRHGGDTALAALEEHNGELPTTVTALTGGGGRHYYFKYVDGIKNSASQIDKGIDVRGDGGYVVASPSIHPSGGRYEWMDGHAPGQIPIAEAPSWLIKAALAPPESSVSSGRARPPDHWRRIFAEGAGEGRRNDTIARLTGHFLSRGHDPWLVLDLMQLFNSARCKPPLSTEEVTAVVDSICKCKRARG